MDFNPLLYQEKYRISTTRWQDRGYGEGFYHVVICTKQRRYYFGYITNDKMHLSPVGEFAKETIDNLKRFYPYVDVCESEVMPNHIHLLLHLSEDAPTASHNHEMVHTEQKRSGLSIVVSGLKRAITMYARSNDIPFDWQERYFDTIIRSAEQYSETQYYIRNNVAKWAEDKLNNANKSVNDGDTR